MKEINQDANLIACLEEFSRNPKGFIVLAGKNGTGKTYAAKAVYEAYARFKLPYYDYEEAILVTQADLQEAWKKSERNWKENALVSEIFNSKLLILDDLGTKTPTPAFNEYLYAIFDKRWNARDEIGTIITTNLNVRDMREKFSDAIVSRIASGTCFKLEGVDRRFDENAF